METAVALWMGGLIRLQYNPGGNPHHMRLKAGSAWGLALHPGAGERIASQGGITADGLNLITRETAAGQAPRCPSDGNHHRPGQRQGCRKASPVSQVPRGRHGSGRAEPHLEGLLIQRRKASALRLRCAKTAPPLTATLCLFFKNKPKKEWKITHTHLCGKPLLFGQ